MDLATIHQILPNPITITLTPQNPAGAPIVVSQCRVRPLKQSQLRMLGELFGLESTYRTFLLPTTSLGGATPKNGDWLTDDSGAVWTVKMGDRELEGTMYRLHCMRQLS